MANPIVMPRLGDFMTEGTISKWNKAAGEGVEQGEVICEIESEKLNYQLEAGGSGVLHRVAGEGDVVPVDGIIAYLLAEGEAPPAAAEAGAPSDAAQRAAARRAPSRQAGRRGDSSVPSTPGARRLAASLDVDIAQVTPTGPRGRVTEGDVRAFAESQQAAPAAAGPRGLPEPASSDALSGMRKSIADHMRSSLAGTAQLSFFMELDVTEAQRLRKEASSTSDVTLSIAHVLTKACAGALKRYPALNSVHVRRPDSHLRRRERRRGRIPARGPRRARRAREPTRRASRRSPGRRPTWRNAQGMALSGPDEVLGGTFTISVLGSVDGFTPILNSGQSAILGVGKSAEKPVVRDGEIVVREMITVSLTVDHQVVDGAVAAGFMRRLQQLVERPAALFR